MIDVGEFLSELLTKLIELLVDYVTRSLSAGANLPW